MKRVIEDGEQEMTVFSQASSSAGAVVLVAISARLARFRFLL
jgi:hypothetical protein